MFDDNSDKVLSYSELIPYARKEVSLCEPLNFCPPNASEEPDSPTLESSDWVQQRAKDFHHFVGLSYEGFEKDLMALFFAIKRDPNQKISISYSIASLDQWIEGKVNFRGCVSLSTMTVREVNLAKAEVSEGCPIVFDEAKDTVLECKRVEREIKG